VSAPALHAASTNLPELISALVAWWLLHVELLFNASVEKRRCHVQLMEGGSCAAMAASKILSVLNWLTGAQHRHHSPLQASVRSPLLPSALGQSLRFLEAPLDDPRSINTSCDHYDVSLVAAAADIYSVP
jgi:hypothetical protein